VSVDYPLGLPTRIIYLDYLPGLPQAQSSLSKDNPFLNINLIKDHISKSTFVNCLTLISQ